jgi:hypothetical protein
MRRPSARAIVPAALAALVVGGAALAVADADANVSAVYAEAERVAGEQGGNEEAVRSYFGGPEFVRQVLTDSMMDGATPRFVTEGEGDDLRVGYGAFGIGGYYPVPPRPWTLQPVAAPLGAAVVIAITATLVAASRWSPPGSRTERERPGRPAGS